MLLEEMSSSSWSCDDDVAHAVENRESFANGMHIFLLAENIGARSLIYLKDEKGLYDRDPKKAGKKSDEDKGVQNLFVVIFMRIHKKVKRL